jgi:hypothetical protein
MDIANCAAAPCSPFSIAESRGDNSMDWNPAL